MNPAVEARHIEQLSHSEDTVLRLASWLAEVSADVALGVAQRDRDQPRELREPDTGDPIPGAGRQQVRPR